MRERVAGAGASVLVHGLALGAALAFSGIPSPHPQRQANVTTMTFAAPAPRSSGRRRAPRPATLHQRQANPPAPIMSAASGMLATASPPVAASTNLSARPAPPMAAPIPAVQQSKPDLAAQRSTYLHRLWLRIMACRPGGLGLAGIVRLAFRVDGHGALTHAQVIGPSGMILLDRAALQALRRAAPFPAPPEDMPVDDEDFEVEIRFG
ncbi:TonB family protein [Novosphingobium sp. KACC 22771]|uniref:TonB family protein n=1 Tax=Novosphingobium sp. KACC 22771 TaxID=3025670 RepID=UPI00236569F3|nr:TonB family protein [Novosphingobium sp. KACC 22771]WDF74469.1 TonB family protein [Novosphingobium sp. KACC 22771]